MIDPFTVPNSNDYMLDGIDLEVTLLYRNTFETKMGTPKPIRQNGWQCEPFDEFDEEK